MEEGLDSVRARPQAGAGQRGKGHSGLRVVAFGALFFRLVPGLRLRAPFFRLRALRLRLPGAEGEGGTRIRGDSDVGILVRPSGGHADGLGASTHGPRQ